MGENSKAPPTTRYLLLVSGLEEDRALCTNVAQAAGLELRVQQKLPEALALLSDPQLGALFLDAPNETDFAVFEKAYRDLHAAGKVSVESNLIHFLTSGTLDSVAYVIRSDLFSNCIQRTSFDPVEAGIVYGRLIRASVREESTIIERVLDVGAEMKRIAPVVSTDKEQCINAVNDFLTERGFPSRIANRIATATDELLMNAIFDAPVDANGKVMFNQTSRATEIRLDGRHEVQLVIGFDGKYAAVSVVDHFGSLQKHLLTDKITRTYQDSAYKVSDAGAGAGLGVFTVFHSGVSLIYSTHPRIKTESVIAFRKTDSVREFKEQFHFLSLMSKKAR